MVSVGINRCGMLFKSRAIVLLPHNEMGSCPLDFRYFDRLIFLLAATSAMLWFAVAVAIALER